MGSGGTEVPFNGGKPQSHERDVTCSQHPSNRLESQAAITGPSRSVVLAVEYLVKVVGEDMRLNNGGTALHWHLIAVIQQHTSR